MGKRRKERRYSEFCSFVERYMLEQFEMQAVQASEAEAMKELWHIERAHMADLLRALGQEK